MYFLSEQDGEVTIIQCAITGKEWKFVTSSSVSRKKAVDSALTFQNDLIRELVIKENLRSTFYTMPELEAAYANHRAKYEAGQRVA